jgi:cytochrome c-type biogenesis protein CcmE
MTKKGQFFFGIACVVSAVGYLMYTGIRETSLYYLTIEEFLPKRTAFADEGVRVAGRVQAGTMNWNPKDLRLSFSLGSFKDGELSSSGVLVRYQGILPDMFAEGRDVIVEGRYSPTDVLEAKTIMTSCPSKYESEVSDQPSAVSQETSVR